MPSPPRSAWSNVDSRSSSRPSAAPVGYPHGPGVTIGDTGFEKDTTIGGRNVHEKYDNKSRHGELIAIVASRFTVSVTSDGVDVGTLEQYAGLVDLSKLEATKDAGVHAQQ
jgi:hypothetical protein